MGETTTECLFCRIASGQAEADVVQRADGVIAFRDIAPQAPVHVLVVPTRHIGSAHELGDADADLLAACFRVAREVAEHEGIAEGYRVATNIGAGGGQAIPHLHLHVIGGRQLGHIDSGPTPG